LTERLEHRVVELVHVIYGGNVEPTPGWLVRPGRGACRRRWALIQSIYKELTGRKLPDEMPPRERRILDAVFHKRGQPPRIVEFDETQHFNRYRAVTLRAYPRSIRLAFPKRKWLEACDAKTRLEGGGFGRPKPPLFPGEGGRHRQRAFRDALADILPVTYGWLPTLRVAKFEVEDWIYGARAKAKMRELLAGRL
jgi:hypothetical protein